jgi:DNA-binding MarR family transcriptional regulator
MNSDNTIVNRFHAEMIELIKKYQFRDRNEMASCGLSVSQCYILETLHRYGPLSMQHLADKMHLTISTITRVIEPLVRKKLVLREKKMKDQRIRIVELSEAGREMSVTSWKNIIESEKRIVESFPPEHREMVVVVLQKINQSFGNWKRSANKK